MEREQENLKVIVRIRPLSKKEHEAIDSYEAFWEGRKRNNNRGKVAQAALNFYTKYHNIRPSEAIKIHNHCVSVCDQQYKNADRKMRDYTFSEVFQESTSNLEIFATLRDEIDGVFQGINCTLLAYGITGSGKTFSVFGHPKIDRGLSHLAFQYIFAKKKELEGPNFKIQLKFSFIEIYNQNIRDLLSEDGKRPVTIGEDTRGNISLIDANEISVRSASQIMELISLGTAKRTSAATEYNLISSRSHAVLKMSVDIIHNEERTQNKLFIIDLAGSEKINNQSNRRRNQGSNINRSLLTLGNCINALVQNQKRPGSSHVPYRDSKLTRLLKDSLGGSARTVMIACISPHPFSLDQTVTTLNYAERAQGIKREITKITKTAQRQCPRCKQLQALVSGKGNKTEENEHLLGANLKQYPLQTVNSEVENIYRQICTRLYEDIIENAKEREQIERLKRQLVEPCQEFELILKDNEEQRLYLKDTLFKLLNQKTKIVVKEPDSKGPSERKKIRLSSSSKKNIFKDKLITQESHNKQNLPSQFETDQKIFSSKFEEEVFPDVFEASFNSPQLFDLEEKDRLSLASPKEQSSRSLQKTHKRKRSKFQVVPKPLNTFGSNVREYRPLSEQKISNF